MITRAAILVQPGEPLQLLDLTIPQLRPGQVLVELHWSGVCRTQWLEAQGLKGPDHFLPHALGHEGSGVVLETGPGVTKVEPGQPVVLSWLKGAGADVPGVRYDCGGEVVNAGAVCTFMHHAVVSENRLTPLPAKMPLQQAALLGCAIPTGVGSVLHTAGVRPGASVAVFGVGGVGMSAILGADLANAARIIAVDVQPGKLELARTLGATDLVNPADGDPADAIAELTSGGADYVFEAVGRPETMQAAFAATRPGGLCVLAGNVAHGQTIRLDPFDLIRGKRLVGTWGGSTEPDRDLPLYAALYLKGRLNLDALLGQVYPLTAINDALAALAAGRELRPLVRLGVEEPEGGV